MADTTFRVADLETLCCGVVRAPSLVADGYQPTPKQIFFFLLVWLVKQKTPFQRKDDPLPGLGQSAAVERTRQIEQNLTDWGDVVTGLKRRNEVEWELLRIQMEKAVWNYACAVEFKAEALQEALLKIWKMLGNMPDVRVLEATTDMVGLVVELRASLTGIYDFSTPFIPFAKRSARNRLIDLIRRATPSSLSLWDDLVETPAPQPYRSEEDEERWNWYRLQLQVDLANLVAFVVCQLTPRRRQVVLHTLAGRSQFWLALDITGQEPPATIPPRQEFVTDDEIGAKLGITAGNVRVHRAYARNQTYAYDAMLGRLLEVLLGTGRGRAGDTNIL